MIATSRAAKLLALICAVAAHAAVALALFDEEQVLIEGGGAVQEARLGASFADMASGRLSPTEAEAPAEPVPPEPVPEESADPVEPAEPVQAPTLEPALTERAERTVTAETQPEVSEPAEAVRADPASPERAEPAEVAETETQPPEQALAALAPELPQAVLPARPASSATPEPSEPPTVAAAEAARVEPAEPAEPEETLVDTERGSGAVTESPRPPPRREVAERREPQRQPPPSARGNADQDATAGAATGRQQADAVRQGTRARPAEAGNAAASNYPGLVSRQLARVRKPAMSRRGATRVAFTVSGAGGLAALSVAQSSGAQRIDQAALDLVRRAAPFPAPPPGARRDFAVLIEFR